MEEENYPKNPKPLNCEGCRYYNKGDGTLEKCQECLKDIEVPRHQEPNLLYCGRWAGEIPDLMPIWSFSEQKVYSSLAILLQECNKLEATMFLQHYILDMSYQEIGSMFDLSQASVCRRISKVSKYIKQSAQVP